MFLVAILVPLGLLGLLECSHVEALLSKKLFIHLLLILHLHLLLEIFEVLSIDAASLGAELVKNLLKDLAFFELLLLFVAHRVEHTYAVLFKQVLHVLRILL